MKNGDDVEVAEWVKEQRREGKGGKIQIQFPSQTRQIPAHKEGTCRAGERGRKAAGAVAERRIREEVCRKEGEEAGLPVVVKAHSIRGFRVRRR